MISLGMAEGTTTSGSSPQDLNFWRELFFYFSDVNQILTSFTRWLSKNKNFSGNAELRRIVPRGITFEREVNPTSPSIIMGQRAKSKVSRQRRRSFGLHTKRLDRIALKLLSHWRVIVIPLF